MRVKTLSSLLLVVLTISIGILVNSKQAIGQQTNVILLTSDIHSDSAMNLQNSFANSLLVVDSSDIVIGTPSEALIIDNSALERISIEFTSAYYRSGGVVVGINVPPDTFTRILGLPCPLRMEVSSEFYIMASRLILARDSADLALIESTERQTCDGSNTSQVRDYAVYTNGLSGQFLSSDEDYMNLFYDLQSHLANIRETRSMFLTETSQVQ